MERLLVVFALGIVVALALAAPAFAADSVLTAGYVPSGDASSGVPIEEGPLAQSFTAEVGGRLAAVDAYLLTFPGDPGSISAELYEITEGDGSTSVPTGDPLAVSPPVAANGPTGFTTFTFSGSDAILEAGHQYALVLTSGSPYVGWALGTDAPASLGNRFSYDTVDGWTVLAGDGCGFYFRVHVGEPTPAGGPAITSPDNYTFTTGTSDLFTITTAGDPTPTIDCTGDLPSGLTFYYWGDGTATFNGTPAVGTGGVYNITITASNGVSPDATQEFTLTVNEAPAITNLNIAAFAEGNPGEFTFTTTGYPRPAITSVGGLPNGLSLVDNGNGTATLSGTPAAGTGGTYRITITAGNSVGSAATQDFYLIVSPPPTIDSEDHCTFTVGTEGTFDVTYFYASGTVCSGDLPSGVIFNGFLGDTYGSFFGTPDPGTGGVYKVTLTTSGPHPTPAMQEFTLTVNEAPAVTTQPTDRTVNAGQTASFSASATGYPLPTVQWQQLGTATGAVWQDIPGATSTLYDVTAQGSLNGCQYRAAFSNGVGDPVYSDAALLTVLSGVTAPAITQQPTDQTVLFGQTATFTAAASGNPAPTVRWQLSTDRGRHWNDIRGAISPSYTTAATTPGMSGHLYRALFRSSAGSATSDAAKLTVNPIPFKVLVGTLQWTGPSRGKYHATLSISIADPSGNPLELAKVRITGVWRSASGRALDTSSGTTDSHGTLRLSVDRLSAQPATFVVTSASKTGYDWQK
jgi:hypothetical protein